MARTGFGLPTPLLNQSATSSTSLQAHSTPISQIPPAPSFAAFRFQSIGHQPGLLKRFSEPDPALGEDETMSVSPEVEQRHQSTEQSVIPRTRPSLLQALVEPSASFGPDTSISDNLVIQASGRSPQFPVAKTTVSTRVSHPSFGPSNGKNDTSSPSSAFMSSSANSHSATQFSMVTSPTGHPTPDDVLGSMQLSYPSASPGPSGTIDQPMSDVQPTHNPDRPSVPPYTHKYDNLRQIQSRLQVTLTKLNPPNLASAILLTETAQQRTDKVYAEARRLHSFSQEIMQAAQKGVAAAETILEAAEQAKGIADGAKAELDRISSKEVNQQRVADTNEVRELIQAVGEWISNHETEEAALRAKRVQQLKLKKQKAELAKASAQPRSTSPLSSSSATTQSEPSTSATAHAPVRAPVPRQPLFFSATPEVDVKMERAGSQLPQLPSALPAGDLSRRQADLRKKLEEKRRSSAEVESRAASPLEAAQLEQQRLEEEKRQEEKKRQEDERKREEQRRKEIVAQKEAERKALEEERKTREKAEAEKKVRAEEERKAHEKAQKEKEEAEIRARERAEGERKAREAAEAERARQAVEAQRKAEEEAEAKKVQAEEEERKRIAVAAFLNQQREAQEKAEQLAAEEKRRKSEEEREKERRLLEEQTRMKAERERQDRLRQEQEIRRQQIQADKNKSMVDRAQQILAQRGHRPQASLDSTSEMSLDSSPGGPTPIVNSSMSLPTLNSNMSPSSSANPLPLIQLLPGQIQSIHTRPIAHSPSTRNSVLPSSHALANGQQLSMGPPQPVTPSNRQISLPPVAHLSPVNSTPPLPPPPLSRPTMSVYRHSGDSGNVPYKENLNTSPQAQVANLKPLLSALNLPAFNATVVKSEPTQDDSTLLYPPEPSGINGDVPARPLSSQPQQVVHGVECRTMVPRHPPQPAGSTSVASRPVHTLPAKHMDGSHTNTILDRLIPSSSVIDIAALSHPQQSQQQQATGNSSQAQLPSKLASSSSSQKSLNDHAPQSEPPLSALVRSESPFRMGPDPLVPQPPPLESPSDSGSDHHAPQPLQLPPAVPAPQPRRPEPSNSTSGHWDHYSPAPPVPRGANVYRPNYPERSRSPVTGRKRSRDYSPPPAPVIRDYRDYDDRRPPPRRHSRSPPPRRSRRPSRSPSPSEYRDRPPLYARLGQTGDDTYRPPSPRESKPSRPELIDRFTDPRSSGVPPARPGRRGKRGRGGPPSGPNHASLEQRISSATLMNRLEDPPRRP